MPTRVLMVLTLVLMPVSLRGAEFYVGAGLGSRVEGGSFRSGLEEVSSSSGDRWKLFAGLALGEHLAVEVGRYDFGDQSCCRNFADLGFSSEVDGLSAALLGRWSFGRLKPFLRAGLLSWEEDGELVTLIGPRKESADNVDVLFGAGLEVDLTSRLALRVEWERYEFDTASSDGVWGSLLFSF